MRRALFALLAAATLLAILPAGTPQASTAATSAGPRMYAIDANNNMQLYTGDGAGKVTGGQLAWPCCGLWVGFKDITVGDFNGDGWPDVAGIDAYGDLRLFLGSASGQLSGGALMWPGGGGWGGFKHIAAADFSGDGAADVAGIDAYGDLRLYRGDRAGHLVATSGALAWPAGGGWAGFKRIAADGRTSACAGTRTVVQVLGDSYATGSGDPAGNGVRSPLVAALGGYGCSWMFVGAQASGTDFYPHEGYPGAAIRTVATHLPGTLPRSAPAGLDVNLLVVFAGANDAGANRSTQQMLDDMSALVDTALAFSPGIRVIVAQPTQIPANTAAQQQALTDYADALPGLLAAKGSRAGWWDARGVAMASDGVHPSQAGYGQIAARLADALHARGWI